MKSFCLIFNSHGHIFLWEDFVIFKKYLLPVKYFFQFDQSSYYHIDKCYESWLKWSYAFLCKCLKALTQKLTSGIPKKSLGCIISH